MDSKQSYEKHEKYVNFYNELKAGDEEYWGIGIENETYLMFDQLTSVTKDFIEKNQKPERYSVDYWTNFKKDNLKWTLSKLPKTVKVPVYINSYLFRNADVYGEHATRYAKGSPANPKFKGVTIDEYMTAVSPVFRTLFEKHMIYDGDTFEFTTFDFYKANVCKVISELNTIKSKFLKEMNARLVNRGTIFKQTLIYPHFNYGLAKFLSNPNNIAVCNNGTYHINITLPTKLSPTGEIQNQDEFKAVHANAIRAIQWVEPLLVALYGSPDILHILDPAYSGGSQRLGFSRYIGLGTYDSDVMEKGKLLDTFNYKSCKQPYFNELHKDTPYIPPEKTGYDFNYNKFTKHGIELRIFDYFPEKYLESLMNFLVLVCQYSVIKQIPDPRMDPLWNHLCMKAIKKGSVTKITPAVRSKLYSVFGLDNWWCPFNSSVIDISNSIAASLYKRYKDKSVCSKLSPNMNPVVLINYNAEIKTKFMGLVR
jgi:hypothetical protein